MKHFGFIILTVCLFNGLKAQVDFNWAMSIGDSGTLEYVQTVNMDDNGNCYATGTFRGTVDFDNSTNSYLLNSNQQDGYVLKQDLSGNLIWVLHLSGPSYEVPRDIVVDNQGNVYVAGGFRDSIQFMMNGSLKTIVSQGQRDAVVLKADQNGQVIWVKTIPSSIASEAWSISLNTSNQLAVSGSFWGTSVFDSIANIVEDSYGDSDDSFTLFLNSDGVFEDLKVIKSTGPGVTIEEVFDNSNSLLLTGRIADTTIIDSAGYPITFVSNGIADVYLIKYNVNNQLEWAKRITGAGFEFGRSFAIDAWNNIYLVGYFSDSSDFDPGVSEFVLRSNGNFDAFMMKLHANGKFDWAKSFGGAMSDYAKSLYIDKDHNLIIGGYYSQTVDFDPGPAVISHTAVDGRDLFLSKYTADGELIWVDAFGGMGEDLINGVYGDDLGNIFVGGHYSGTIDFDPGTSTYPLTPVNGIDGFLAMYNDPVFDILEHDFYEPKLYPNPTSGILNVAFSKSANGTLNVYTIDGKLLQSEELVDTKECSIMLREALSSTYIIEIIQEKSQFRRKVVLIE